MCLASLSLRDYRGLATKGGAQRWEISPLKFTARRGPALFSEENVEWTNNARRGLSAIIEKGSFSGLTEVSGGPNTKALSIKV